MRIVSKPSIAILVKMIIDPPTACQPKTMPSANENGEVLCVEQGNFAMCLNPPHHKEKMIDCTHNMLHLGPGCLDDTGPVSNTDPTPLSDQRMKSDIGCLI